MVRRARVRESSNFAIVIGIDAYQNADWNLGAAVGDALKFTQWALDHGGVQPENLRLLLSPMTGGNVTALPYQPATRGNIVQTILDFQENQAGRNGARLYFYFAGHGLSAPGAKAASQFLSEPVIVPSDVADIKRDAALLIGFSDIFPTLFAAQPLEQFFFIDACRDFELEDFRPAIGRAVGPYNPSLDNVSAAAGSAQYILYATSPGQRAFEVEAIGRGVFADALLDGLQGNGSAVVWSPSTERYEVRFNKLADYVASRIKGTIEGVLKDKRVANLSQFIQIPQPRYPQNATPDASIISFSDKEIKPIEVKLKVSPPAARSSCKVEALYYVPGGRKRYVAVEETGPPFCPPCTFELLPGEYTLRAQAASYGEDRKALSLYETQSVSLSLKRERGAPPPARPGQKRGPGRVSIVSPDNKVVIIVRDSEKRPVSTGVGRIWTSLPPGIYQVDAILPDQIKSQTIEVLGGDDKHISLDLPGARLGKRQLDMLQRMGIDRDPQGHVHPAEVIGVVAEAKLASLLGFAAFAANWPEADKFTKLKGFGIKTPKVVEPGGSGLLVVVGVGGGDELIGMSASEFLSAGRMSVRGYSGKRASRKFHILDEFPDAAEQQMVLKPDSYFLDLDLPGFTPTRYAVSCLPDRITVVVVAIEESGEVAVQQYLFPVLSKRRAYTHNDRVIGAADLRRIELAQRYYANAHEIPGRELDDLLYGKWIDPLLGCVAGYSLIRAGNAKRYIGRPNLNAGPRQPEHSAMRNMLKLFGELPDSHVLAGLCDPGRRKQHYQRAAEIGVPVFAEGFRVLYEWYRQTGIQMPKRLANRGANLLPASPWTAWLNS